MRCGQESGNWDLLLSLLCPVECCGLWDIQSILCGILRGILQGHTQFTGSLWWCLLVEGSEVWCSHHSGLITGGELVT